MSLHPMPRTFSTRALQRQYRAIITALRSSRGAVLLLNHHTPEAVLLDVETYNVLVGGDDVYDEPRVARLIAEARTSHRRGKSKMLRSWGALDQ